MKENRSFLHSRIHESIRKANEAIRLANEALSEATTALNALEELTDDQLDQVTGAGEAYEFYGDKADLTRIVKEPRFLAGAIVKEPR